MAEGSLQWLAGVDVAIRTEDFYRSMRRCHVVPRWGGHALTDVAGVKVQVWANELRGRGYARVTVAGIVKLLSLMLADAREERLIPANPVRARRRGRRRHDPAAERVWAEPGDVLAVADNAARLPAGVRHRRC